MKIRYSTIKKIHLYACLSTVAFLLMFIVTSYLMIHHQWFDHEEHRETSDVDLGFRVDTEEDWQKLVDRFDVKGRLYRSSTNKDGHQVRIYETANNSNRITLSADRTKAQMVLTSERGANILVGIHRHRGYGGALQYNLYALFLDLLGVSLIVFAITGVIMWFKLLKNNRIAWIIFIAGFLYFSLVIFLLMYL